MISGIFEDDIREYLNNIGSVNTLQQSQDDLDAVSSPFRGLFQPGKMYTFRYFTPDEEFYDTMPIVIALEYSMKENLIGLNLHYFPIDARIEILSRIIRSYEPVFSSETRDRKITKPEQQRQFGRSFNYLSLKEAYQQKLNVLHGVRQYRLDRIQSPKIIGYENWYIGASNNTDMFLGANIAYAQSLYRT